MIRWVCVAVCALAGCHDWDQFQHDPDGGSAADLLGSGPPPDLAGCTPFDDLPTPQSGCSLFAFNGGDVPPALTVAPNLDGHVHVTRDCRGLHVAIDAGMTHDLWADNTASFQISAKIAPGGGVAASFDASLASAQQLVAVYESQDADPARSRFVSAQAIRDIDQMPHDHFSEIDNTHSPGTVEVNSFLAPTAATGPYILTLSPQSVTNAYDMQDSRGGSGTVTPTSTLVATYAGAAIGNASSLSTTPPAFDAYLRWIMICGIQ